MKYFKRWLLWCSQIGKDGEIERLNTELSELHKSKRQLLELIEHKDLEISEKDSTIKSYLDKIVSSSYYSDMPSHAIKFVAKIKISAHNTSSC